MEKHSDWLFPSSEVLIFSNSVFVICTSQTLWLLVIDHPPPTHLPAPHQGFLVPRCVCGWKWPTITNINKAHGLEQYFNTPPCIERVRSILYKTWYEGMACTYEDTSETYSKPLFLRWRSRRFSFRLRDWFERLNKLSGRETNIKEKTGKKKPQSLSVWWVGNMNLTVKHPERKPAGRKTSERITKMCVYCRLTLCLW